MMKISANTTKWTCLLASTCSFALQVLTEYLISDPKSYRDFRETDIGWTLLENAVIPVRSIISSWCFDIKDETPLHEIDKLFANILIYN